MEGLDQFIQTEWKHLQITLSKSSLIIQVMNNKQKLVIAHVQVENLLALTKGMQYENYIQGKLHGIKYELERQLNNCHNQLDKTV